MRLAFSSCVSDGGLPRGKGLLAISFSSPGARIVAAKRIAYFHLSPPAETGAAGQHDYDGAHSAAESRQLLVARIVPRGRERHALTLGLGWLAAPHGFLPTQTAVESLTIGVGRDGNPRPEKGSPITFDRWAPESSSVTVDSSRRFPSRL